MTDKISRRIARTAGVPDLEELLSERLSGSDLHSLLLPVVKRRVGSLVPAVLLNSSKVTRACDLDARLISQVECLQYEISSDYEAVELSPLAPLGSIGILAGLDQGNVLSTIRSFECASDPTIGLALECARRRKNPDARRIATRLCTSQRVVRFPVPSNPAYSAHFKLFSMVDAGRDAGSFAFEIRSLREQIGFYLSLFSRLERMGFKFEDVTVELSDTRVVAQLCSMFGVDREKIKALVRARDSDSSDRLMAQHQVTWPKLVVNPSDELKELRLSREHIIQLNALAEGVFEPLRDKYSNAQFRFNMHRLTGLGYYQGPCFHLKTKNSGGASFMLADGGFVDWTQRLLGDSKERLMTSAIGTELICRLFRAEL